LLLVTPVVPLHHLHLLLVAPVVQRPPLRTGIHLHWLLIAPVVQPSLRTGLHLHLHLLITPVGFQPHHLLVVPVVVPLLRTGLHLPLLMIPVVALHLHLLGTTGVPWL
jgi:hypothetical protein